MKFVMHRDRTIASTCGLSIEFKKGVAALVSPGMYAEVIAAGAVPEEELPDDEAAHAKTPEGKAERDAAITKAFETIALRNNSEDFTAGGLPHNKVVSELAGFPVSAKVRDEAWLKFTQAKG